MKSSQLLKASIYAAIKSLQSSFGWIFFRRSSDKRSVGLSEFVHLSYAVTG